MIRLLAWHRLHVFTLRSDWFIGLSASIVIGQTTTTTTTTTSLFQVTYNLQSLCSQLVRAIRGGQKRKKKKKITVVLVLLHSIENCSIQGCDK